LPGPRRLTLLVPVLLIAAIFAVVAVVGFGSSEGGRLSRAEIRQEVAELLANVPQDGTTLGSPDAPITLRVFGDIECPTVKRFVMNHLPSIVETWVRPGVIKIDYRSLQTDTVNEGTFFRQETAALAAGRQDRLWNFVATFVRQQGRLRSAYATDEFIAGIASQLPGLERTQWRRDWGDALLSTQVALGIHRAHLEDMYATPAFLIGRTGGDDYERIGAAVESGPLITAASLAPYVESLS